MSSDNYKVRVLASAPQETTFRVAMAGNGGFEGFPPFGRAFALWLLAHGARKQRDAHPWLADFEEFGCVDEAWMRAHAPDHIRAVEQLAHAHFVATDSDAQALEARIVRTAEGLLESAPQMDLRVTWAAESGHLFAPNEVFGTTGYDVFRENPPPYASTRQARVFHRAGTSTVLGQAQAVYGLFKDEAGTSLTHLPTGMALSGPLEAARAEALLDALVAAAPEAGVEFSFAPSEVPMGLVDMLRPIVRSVI
jgi:hypothetical protein